MNQSSLDNIDIDLTFILKQKFSFRMFLIKIIGIVNRRVNNIFINRIWNYREFTFY